MEILVGVLGGAVLFVLYGLLMLRRRDGRAGPGCVCGAIGGGCGSCRGNPDPRESGHDRR